MRQKKRVGPKAVEPVTCDGVRYEALRWGKERDLGQNGGFVVAFDEISGDELWLQKIYDVVYDNEMESDKQDVFITGLELDENREELLISNERGERFGMSLSDRRVVTR